MEYKALLLTGKTSASFQAKLDTVKTENGLTKLSIDIKETVKFIAFRAGFPGNECFNASMALLYPRIVIAINGAEVVQPVGSMVGDVGAPVTDMKTAMI